MQKQLTPKLVTAIISAGIMAFAGVVAETAMNITFPTLMREFGIGTAAVQWLTTGYLLMLAAAFADSRAFNRTCKSAA